MNAATAQIRRFFWPLLIGESAIGMVVLMIRNVDSPVRIAFAFWFICFCPGLAFVNVLKLDGALVKITCSVALSLALVILVSEAMAYAGTWSPINGIIILAILCFIGIGLQFLSSTMRQIFLNRSASDDIPGQ